MPITKRQIILLIPPVIVLALFLVIITGRTNGITNSESTDSNLELVQTTTPAPATNNLVEQAENSTVTLNPATTVAEAADIKVLDIDTSKCIGCGKCVRVDSEHFDLEGNYAAVTSQKNIDSSALMSAINICPGGAISLD